MRQAWKIGMKGILVAALIGMLGPIGFAQEVLPTPTPLSSESASPTPTPTPTPSPQRVYSADELKADFEQFRQEILNKNPLRFANRQELIHTFETQSHQIRNGMFEWEFYRVLTPIIAKVNCSHTYLQPSRDYENYLVNEGKFLPLEIKVIRGRAYIYQNFSSILIPVGAEVVSINGKSISEIVTLFLNNLAADGKNLTRKYYMINRNFSLYFQRFIDQPDEFIIKYVDPQDGQTKQVQVIALTHAAQAANTVQGVIPTPPVDNSAYSQHFQKNYAILTIRSFAFYHNHSKLRFFIDHFFNEVATKKIPDIIIDLRGNSGGNSLCTAHLLSYLISVPTPYFAKDSTAYELTLPILPAKKAFSGKVRILADGGSIGATGHLISLLKYHKIGILIGEETGGTYTYTDAAQYVVLKNTGLRLYCSTREFKTEVSGFTPDRGILPDVEITPALSDYLSGRDLVKDYALWSMENEGKK